MEFSLIFMMQIFSGMFGAWIGFFLTDRFFAKMRQKEEIAAQQKKFEADVNYIRDSVRDISADLAELEQRFNNGPCGNGSTFNCLAACKELEEEIREFKASRNISTTQTPA